MVSATWEEVCARRVVRSALVPRVPAERLVQVVHDLGGVHAQVQASAELQLASRIDGLTQGDAQEALWERRSLVKAWTLRGTLHLHPADELALWHAARRAVVGTPAELPAWRDPAGVLHPEVGRDEVEAIRRAVWEALDGRCLLREELADEVVRRVGGRHEQRLRSGFAFFLGELCQGPPRGAKVTFVRPDQWIDGWHEVDADRALAEVCRRYLRTYGPARPSDFRSGSRDARSSRRHRRCSTRWAGSKRSTSKGTEPSSSRGTLPFPRGSRVYGCCPSTTSTSWASANATGWFLRS